MRCIGNAGQRLGDDGQQCRVVFDQGGEQFRDDFGDGGAMGVDHVFEVVGLFEQGIECFHASRLVQKLCYGYQSTGEKSVNYRQAMKGMCDAAGGIAAAAKAIGISLHALKCRVYENRGQSISVAQALRLQALSGSSLFAEYVAAASGGAFVRLPECGPVGNEEISAKFHELYQELGELSQEFCEMNAKGEMTTADQVKVNQTIERMHKTQEEMRALMYRVFCHETAKKTGSVYAIA